MGLLRRTSFFATRSLTADRVRSEGGFKGFVMAPDLLDAPQLCWACWWEEQAARPSSSGSVVSVYPRAARALQGPQASGGVGVKGDCDKCKDSQLEMTVAVLSARRRNAECFEKFFRAN